MFRELVYNCTYSFRLGQELVVRILLLLMEIKLVQKGRINLGVKFTMNPGCSLCPGIEARGDVTRCLHVH